MMRLKQFIIAALLLIGFAPAIKAQQLWLSAEGRANITKALRAEIEVEHRSKDQFKATSRWSAEAGLSYKCLSWLRVGASYKFMEDRDGDKTTKKGNYIPAYWQPGHRVQISAAGSLKFGKFEFSLREAYQYTFYPGQSVDKYDEFGNQKKDEYIDEDNRHILRSRIAAEFKYKKKALVTPFASIESYNDLEEGFSFRKLRYTAGADFRINKHHSISAFYRFIQRFSSENTNVIGIGYQYKL